jgi:hypothetical protein
MKKYKNATATTYFFIPLVITDHQTTHYININEDELVLMTICFNFIDEFFYVSHSYFTTLNIVNIVFELGNDHFGDFPFTFKF